MHARSALVVAVALAVALLPRAASAQKGPKKVTNACGLKLLPLAVGNSWTFEQAVPPALPNEATLRLSPAQPKKLVVTVTSLETVDGKSVVHLTEQADDHKSDTTIRCGGGVFEVSPDSVFFTGEPGGAYNISFTKMDRKLIDGVGLGAPWSYKWREDIVGEFTRSADAAVKADLGKGKLEIERRITLGGRAEPIDVPYKAPIPATIMTIELTGRVTFDGDSKASEMPANWVTAIWFADGVGPVQIQNMYAHMYKLADATIVK